MKQPSLGDQELQALMFIADHAPVAARDVADHFAEEHGLARTTVLTVIERLRKKGYLRRARRGGVYQYFPSTPQDEVLQGVVSQFVENTLGGSVSPLIAYLTENRELSDDELAEIERLVEELRAEKDQRKGGGR